MAKIVALFVVMVVLAAVVECRDWRFKSLKRMKRGYNSGLGGDASRTYGQSDEDNASVSREGLTVCSGEGDRGYGGSRELGYNRDNFSNENKRGHRSFSKSTASATASASAVNKNHNAAI